jgi:hemerythrin
MYEEMNIMFIMETIQKDFLKQKTILMHTASTKITEFEAEGRLFEKIYNQLVTSWVIKYVAKMDSSLKDKFKETLKTYISSKVVTDNDLILNIEKQLRKI